MSQRVGPAAPAAALIAVGGAIVAAWSLLLSLDVLAALPEGVYQALALVAPAAGVIFALTAGGLLAACLVRVELGWFRAYCFRLLSSS